MGDRGVPAGLVLVVVRFAVLSSREQGGGWRLAVCWRGEVLFVLLQRGRGGGRGGGTRRVPAQFGPGAGCGSQVSELKSRRLVRRLLAAAVLGRDGPGGHV